MQNKNSVLFIVHATSWSDKRINAKEGIEHLIKNNIYSKIIEVIQSPSGIYSKRYLKHDGIIYTHDEISPVKFFRNHLFSKDNIFPLADEITLTGGVFNSTGGGCLNVAFDFLADYLYTNNKSSRIIISGNSCYNSDLDFTDNFQFEQCIKDLVWKLTSRKIPFDINDNNDGKYIINLLINS